MHRRGRAYAVTRGRSSAAPMQSPRCAGTQVWGWAGDVGRGGGARGEGRLELLWRAAGAHAAGVSGCVALEVRTAPGARVRVWRRVRPPVSRRGAVAVPAVTKRAAACRGRRRERRRAAACGVSWSGGGGARRAAPSSGAPRLSSLGHARHAAALCVVESYTASAPQGPCPGYSVSGASTREAASDMRRVLDTASWMVPQGRSRCAAGPGCAEGRGLCGWRSRDP
jgi:hypothetical protein